MVGTVYKELHPNPAFKNKHIVNCCVCLRTTYDYSMYGVMSVLHDRLITIKRFFVMVPFEQSVFIIWLTVLFCASFKKQCSLKH